MHVPRYFFSLVFLSHHVPVLSQPPHPTVYLHSPSISSPPPRSIFLLHPFYSPPSLFMRMWSDPLALRVFVHARQARNKNIKFLYHPLSETSVDHCHMTYRHGCVCWFHVLYVSQMLCKPIAGKRKRKCMEGL